VRRHSSLDDRFDPAIRVVDHDPAWPAEADTEIRRIRNALGATAVRLDHVGSTAIPGLAAKPIIDLQLSVSEIDALDAYRGPLERLGYLFVPDPGSPDLHLFALPAERPRSHHLHVCESGSEHELRHLAVRDFLRANGTEAREYEALKRVLAGRHPQDRLAYIEGKAEYMAALETRARAWACGQSSSLSSSS
jgi:GrpB-like predicted nucleotidyltransferase (UPF0157 family)